MSDIYSRELAESPAFGAAFSDALTELQQRPVIFF
jgi:hypothetical protein